MGRRLAVAAAVTALGALAACRPGTVVVEARLEVGDQARFRYEIEATVTREIEGESPTTISLDVELVADQEVVEVTDDGARARVTLRRAGAAPRSTEVLLDRTGAIRSIELVEGLAEGGLGELGALLPPATTPPPTPLAPGARWSIQEGSVEGRGRLERLGVIDGRDVAVVATSIADRLEDAVAAGDGEATLGGLLRADTTAAYDLGDGSLRRSSARSHGEVRARISPPAGVDAAPLDARITYEIVVAVTRLN